MKAIPSRKYKLTAPLFLASAFIALVLLPMFQKGTFIDGMLYKTVGFNYATGTSSFWRMMYTETCMNFFCEQPPLYPFLAGSFYRLFGVHYLVDRFFTLFLLLLFVLLLHACVKKLFAGARGYYFGLLVFFVLCVPVWCWSYVNQVIEPLVCVFTVAGILCFVNYRIERKPVYMLLFSGMLYLSFLSKGFQSCFLITLPVFYMLFSKPGRRSFFIFAGVSLGLLLLALGYTLFFYGPAATWFTCYYNSRLVLTMQNVGNTTDHHFEIVIRFFTELVAPIGVFILLLMYLGVRKKYPVKFAFYNFVSNRLAVSLLLCSFTGSLPFAASLVQRGFYLIPAFVCFLLALVYGFRRYWLLLLRPLMHVSGYKIIRLAMVLVFIVSMAWFITCVSSYKRDEALLHDLDKMLPYLTQKDTVLIEKDLWNYFNLHSYLYMERQISLSIVIKKTKFMICNKPVTGAGAARSGFISLNLPTQQLELLVAKP